MNLALMVAAVLFSVAFVLVFVRLVRGPSLPDRVIALDFLAVLGISVIAVYSIATNQAVYLDVAIVLALISFVGTIAFAYYIERRT